MSLYSYIEQLIRHSYKLDDHGIQTESGAHPASYPMDRWLFPQE
jgi:hypothetical protein